MARGTGASSFDELAVGLSSGTLSRGKALRLMGAALVGSALASVPGVTLAQRPAQAQTICPNPAEACCTCRYNEPETPGTIFRTKCFVFRTRTCRERRVNRLVAKCQEFCEENRPRRLETQGISFTCATGQNNNAVCDRVATGTECIFAECTQPIGVTVETVKRTRRTP